MKRFKEIDRECKPCPQPILAARFARGGDCTRVARLASGVGPETNRSHRGDEFGGRELRASHVVRRLSGDEAVSLRRLLPEAGPLRAATFVVLALSQLRRQVPAAAALPRRDPLCKRLLRQTLPGVPDGAALRRPSEVRRCLNEVTTGLRCASPNVTKEKIPGDRMTAEDQLSQYDASSATSSSTSWHAKHSTAFRPRSKLRFPHNTLAHPSLSRPAAPNCRSTTLESSSSMPASRSRSVWPLWPMSHLALPPLASLRRTPFRPAAPLLRLSQSTAGSSRAEPCSNTPF